MPPAPTRVGLFNELAQDADYLWNQCDGSAGRHGAIELARWDQSAPHAFIMNWPSPPGGVRRAGGWRRYLYKALRRSTTPLRMRHAFDRLGRDAASTTVLFYEPPSLIPDYWYDVARKHAARVYAPDPRATHPITLPSMWSIEWDVHTLRALPPPAKSVPLAAISSGMPSGKKLTAGHRARLDFYRALRAANVPIEIFGRGLPADTGSRGPIACKGNILRPARFALVIENYAEGDMYVSEKLWDALACWALPLYFGSRAADRLIPSDALIRIPSLDAEGVRVVQQALADPVQWDRRLEAMAEARRRALGDLRLVEWVARNLRQWSQPTADTPQI